jgi:uncharacterized delta-60 repeat protein
LPASEENVDAITESTSPNTVQSNNHHLLAYSLIHVDTSDPGNVEFEIVPVRSSSMHLNILKLLETGICTDCFKIVGSNFPEPGILDVDIEITHPFSELKYTIFDVRGILMFNGSHLFPESGLTMSDSSMGDRELLNAEGYTQLYNGSTLGMAGDFFTFYEGKFATPTVPDADLNGFIRHITDLPVNIRNALYSGDSITRTYRIGLAAGEFAIGYAVDASWELADPGPVFDPMTQFPITANCVEPWNIVASGLALIDDGSTTLSIDVYDWEGMDTISAVYVECPELFTGQVAASFLQDGPGYTIYETVISNDFGAPVGSYDALISAEAVENATSSDWVDLTAYNIHNIDVVLPIGGGTLLWAKRAGGTSKAVAIGITTLSDDSFVVTGHFWGSATFGTGEPNETVLVSHGYNDIFIARYNPDGTLVWAKNVGGLKRDKGIGITTLSDDSTVVTGRFDESSTFGEGEPNETVLVSHGSRDIFIARYFPDGTLAWAKRAGGSGTDYGFGITALSDTSTVVTGCFRVSATFGEGEANETVLVTNGGYDIFLARYNPDGTLEWAKRAGGYKDREGGSGITTLSDNSVVITGNFNSTATFGEGEPNETILVANGYWHEIFIARYNPDGTLAWAKRESGTGNCSGTGITTLSDDSTVVTGRFRGTMTFGEGEPNETVLVTDGGYDIFIARYNPDGSLAWAKSAGSYYGDHGISLTTLSDNSFAVTGYFNISATFGEGEPNETVLVSEGDRDLFVARYNPDGTLDWVIRAGGINVDEGFGIASLSDNSLVVTGRYRDIATFGQDELNQTVLTSAGSYDIYIARFMP